MHVYTEKVVQHAMCGERTADSMCCAQTAVLGKVCTEDGHTRGFTEVLRAQNGRKSNPRMYVKSAPEKPVGRVRGAP